MARDFLALQEECLQYGYTERERAFFKTWINEAAWDVASRYEWRWLDSEFTITTVAGTATVAAPNALMMFPTRLRPNQAGIHEPKFVPWDSYADQFHRRFADTTVRGVPTEYSFNDDSIVFSPIPDAVYAYKLYGQMVPTEMTLDATQPWMPTEHRGVLVSGAMMKMAARDKDFNAAQFWSDQYEGQIAKMRMADMKTGSGWPRKVPMPRNYGWDN